VSAGADINQAPLFFEPGASWFWLLSGPLSAGTMLMIERSSGYGWEIAVPVVFLLLVTAFVGLQVKAARIHASVELTERTLRQGTESIPVDDILRVLPAADSDAASNGPQPWQSARTLGELVGVPRGRVGIGLKLAGGRTVQAWARRHRDLRAALTQLVEQRGGFVEPDYWSDYGDGSDDAGSRW
jgi:hypothetical protein